MWDWIKKWWGLVAAGIGGFLAFLIGYEVKKGLDGEPAAPPGPDPNIKKADDAQTKEDQQASDQKTKDQQDDEKRHDQDVQAVVTQEQQQSGNLVNDPEAENDFIKKAGQDVRK